MTEEFLRNAMETHGDAVYRLALCRLQSVPDAEDVYQDVFLRLLGQTAERWEDDHLKAWLLRATVNRCTDLRRFRLRRQTLSLEEVPELAQFDEDTTVLWEAVAGLPEKLRTVVHLYYAENYQTEEIGGLLGISSSTVRTRLRRARLKLKDLLGGYEDGKQLSEAVETYSRT